MATVPSWQLKHARDGPFGDAATAACMLETGTLLVLYILNAEDVV